MFTQFFCNLNSSKNITFPSGKLRTEFISLIAKSTSPGLSDTTFFAHWLHSIWMTAFCHWSLCDYLRRKCPWNVESALYQFLAHLFNADYGTHPIALTGSKSVLKIYRSFKTAQHEFTEVAHSSLLAPGIGSISTSEDSNIYKHM